MITISWEDSRGKTHKKKISNRQLKNNLVRLHSQNYNHKFTFEEVLSAYDLSDRCDMTRTMLGVEVSAVLFLLNIFP